MIMVSISPDRNVTFLLILIFLTFISVSLLHVNVVQFKYKLFDEGKKSLKNSTDCFTGIYLVNCRMQYSS